MKIALSNILVTLLEVHILKSSDQVDAFTLAKMDRLYYECLVVLLFVELRSEVIHFLRQDPCLWKEVIIIWEGLAHPHQISTKIILPCQLIHAWIMIYSLMGHKLSKLFGCCPLCIIPIYVPISSLVVSHLKSKLSQCFFHYNISAFCGAKVEILLRLRGC